MIYFAGEVDGDVINDCNSQLREILDSTEGVKNYIFHLQKLDYINSIIIQFNSINDVISFMELSRD